MRESSTSGDGVRTRYLAVWTGPVGALFGIGAAIIGGVHRLPTATADVTVGLLVAIVFATTSWGPEMFLPGIDGRGVSPSPLTVVMSLASVILMAFWPLAPVVALVAEGCKDTFVIGWIFASIGSASCYAIMAGLAGGLRMRLRQDAVEP